MTHGALLVHTRVALHIHVELIVLGQKLDLHLLTRLLPATGRKLGLESVQPPLRRPDQVPRTAFTHQRQMRLRGNTPIHHPDTARLAVERLKAFQKLRYRTVPA